MVPKKDSEGRETRDLVHAPYTQEEERSVKEWKAELKAWKRGEAIVKQQIAATIPDSLFMKVRDKGTALEIWEALQGDFQNKSRMVAVDLRRRLQQEKCAEKGDIRAHFAKLRKMREDLAAMGHPPGEDEFYAIILGSLPYSFEPFISALNATSSVLGTVLSPDELMQAFTDEYDRRNLGKSSKKEEENTAFSAEDSNSNGSSRKGNDQRGKCYNCGKPGHRKDDCWEEGGGKEGQKPHWLKEKEKWQKERREGTSDKEKVKPKPKESATTAMIEDVAWMAYISDSEDNDDIVSTVSSDEGSVDWWDEQVEGEREEFDEQVDEMGNQPIPQPSEPEAITRKGTELPLAQPEEQGKCGGKVASDESADNDEWAATVSTDAMEDRESSYETAKGEIEWPEEAGAGVLPHTPYPNAEPASEYYSDVMWNPWAVDEIQGESGGGGKAASGESGKGVDEVNEAKKDPEKGRHKVCPGAADDAKSILHLRNPARSNFDDAEPVSTRIDHENFLSDGQHLPSPAKFMKTKNLPYREGIGPPLCTPKPNAAISIAINAITPKFREKPPHLSSDKSRGRGGTSWVNPRKHAEGGTRANPAKRDFRGLGGEEDISLISGDEENGLKGHLPFFQDPGGVPQHSRVGYRPMEDSRPVPGAPRKGTRTISTRMGAEEDGSRWHTDVAARSGLPILESVPITRNSHTARAEFFNNQRHACT
jgi:hypothetical protein